MNPPLSNMKALKKECDRLWSLLVKIRAGMKSEINGSSECLNSHHLFGKSTYRLRWDLDNGVCCTKGEHFFGFHHTGRRAKYEEIIFKKRGEATIQKLKSLKWDMCKTSVIGTYWFLFAELEKINAGKDEKERGW